MRCRIEDDRLIIDQMKTSTDLIQQIKSVVAMRLVQPLINQGLVIFNGKIIKTTCMVRSSFDRISIPLNEPTIPYGINTDPLHILYEDEVFLIVSKPKGILIYDLDDPTNADTLVALVHGYYQTHGIHAGIYPVHRLDKDTSGIMVLVKHQLVLPLVSTLFESHAIHRQYQALVFGMVKPKHQVIDRPIGKDRHHNNRYMVLPTGKPSTTRIDVIDTGCYKHQPVSLIKATLYTGRTHQIRVHLSSIHHPLVNDPYYGRIIDDTGLKLHAYHIQFQHPFTHASIDVTDPIDLMES